MLNNDGLITDFTLPIAIAGLNDVTAITSGMNHSCALVVDASLRCWGMPHAAGGIVGSLGNGSFADSPTPVVVAGIGDATSVSAGWYHTCAARAAGLLSCWGWNGWQELGIRPPDTLNPFSALPVLANAQGAVEVDGGRDLTCDRLDNGSVRCWGEQGLWGDGSPFATASSPNPHVVADVSDATRVDVGGEHACILRATARVSCWGSNSTGQLGDGSTATALTPVDVLGVSDAIQISAGGYTDAGGEHTCALHRDSTVSCWGANNVGQLGNGATVNSATPTTVVSQP